MSQTSLPADRTFSCDHCGGEIRIPYDLPPTTAPCPMCGKETTSPPPPAAPAGEDPLVPLEQVESAADLALDPLLGKGGEDVAAAAAVTPPAEAPPERSAEPVRPESAPVAAEAASGRAETAAARVAESPPADVPPGGGLPGAGPTLEDALPAEGEKGFRNINPIVPFVGVIALIVLLLVAAILMNRGRQPSGTAGVNRSAVERSRFLREGWRQAATERLSEFIKAPTVEERAQHVMGGASRVPDLERFYADGDLNEADTPFSAFSHFELELADKERGIFMMRYERPAQFDMREFFRPVAPLDIQYRLKDPGLLLSSFASLQNFAMEPVRVMAFFKQEGEELFLDWDVFAQTKHRTLRDFVGYPQAGAERIFRVIVNEDVPATGRQDPSKVRYYRFADPAHSSDHVKIPVAVGSKEGRILESLNWIGLPGRGVPSQTATVRLGWSEGESPQVELREIICWEFLGLGGVEGNAVPGVKYNPIPESSGDGSGEEAAPAAGQPAGPKA